MKPGCPSHPTPAAGSRAPANVGPVVVLRLHPSQPDRSDGILHSPLQASDVCLWPHKPKLPNPPGHLSAATLPSNMHSLSLSLCRASSPRNVCTLYDPLPALLRSQPRSGAEAELSSKLGAGFATALAEDPPARVRISRHYDVGKMNCLRGPSFGPNVGVIGPVRSAVVGGRVPSPCAKIMCRELD